MGRKKNPKGIWIPWEVWEDDRLGIHDKVAFVVISGLARGEGGCFATNKQLAEFCKISERQVCRAVGNLTELGYLRTENAGSPVRRIYVEQRQIGAVTTPEWRGMDAELAQSERQNDTVITPDWRGEDGFLPSLSIDNNNYNNIYNYAREETDTKPTKKEIEDWCRERGSSVNPGRFFEYYEAVHWQDRDGTPVNWKQRILSWEAQEERRAQETGQADKAVPAESSFETDSFFAAALARSEVPADDEIPPWLKGD